jgi:hypothetical protein
MRREHVFGDEVGPVTGNGGEVRAGAHAVC